MISSQALAVMFSTLLGERTMFYDKFLLISLHIIIIQCTGVKALTTINVEYRKGKTNCKS